MTSRSGGRLYAISCSDFWDHVPARGLEVRVD